MGMTTELITYNVKERGRKYNGSERNFNVPAIVRLLNGPIIQEKVNSNDLVGYLGHGIRQEFGLNPPEVALSEGKVIPLDPAFVTCHLKAYEDGTIEHKVRFLDTPLGKTAQEWFESKTGGFSSVFAPDEKNPTDFHGFDYVRAPNYSFNRGYVLDSADEGAVYKEFNRLTAKHKFELLQAQNIETLAVMDAMRQTYQGLFGRVSSIGKTNEQMQATLDAMENLLQEKEHQLRDTSFELKRLTPKHEPLVRLNVGEGNWLESSVAAFDSVERGKVASVREPNSILELFK